MLGLLGAFALARLLTTELWELTPTDPLTFTVVALLLLLVASVACVVPTWRAIRVNAILALRQE
jgi:ABC-type lipoprotein release transport system permease subunit